MTDSAEGSGTPDAALPDDADATSDGDKPGSEPRPQRFFELLSGIADLDDPVVADDAVEDESDDTPEAVEDVEDVDVANEDEDEDEIAPTVDLGEWGSVTTLEENEMRVAEIRLAPGVGARFVAPPVAPVFTYPTLTGLGPGGAGGGLSLTVGGHTLEGHRGAAVMWGTERGPSHADFAEPCQDASAARHVTDDIVVLAVADGVSQGRHSGDVATSAVVFGLDWLANAVEDGATIESLDLAACVDAVNEHLQEESDRLVDEREAADATTVAFAAVDLRLRTARFCRVGDSTAWILRPSSGFELLFSNSKEREDGFVSGASFALPSAEPHHDHRSDIIELDEARAVLLCTDGVGDELVTGESGFARWLAEFMKDPIDPLSFAYWLSMRIRGATDDRGAAVCWLPSVGDASDNL